MKTHVSRFTLSILSLLSITYSSQICDFRLSDCPESFNNQIIYVPKDVTAFSSKFFVCKRTSVIEGAVSRKSPPSIMFVLDHSGTMTGMNTNTSPRDSGGTRFKVTGAILDSIYKLYPDAEAGLIIFQEVIYFDTRDNPVFASLPTGYQSPSGYETQGYIPLLRLDSTLSNGKKGIDFIKDCLETKKSPVVTSLRSTDITTDLIYHPRYSTLGYTNINTPFDAVRDAMTRARYAKDNRFVILLSDGEPYPEKNSPDLHGGKSYLDFVNGTDMPTTFTVYFNPDSKNPPRSLSTMTSNIQSNNYSTTNTNSSIWTINTSYSTLLNLLMNNVINNMLQPVKQDPSSLVLNGTTYRNYVSTDSSFYIPGGVVLNDSITHIDLTITYKVTNTTTSMSKDTIVKTQFDVVRSDRIPQSADIIINCNDTTLYKVDVIATDARGSETNSDQGIFEISRNNPTGTIRVYYEIRGTAITGVDYTRITDSVEFTSGITKTSIIIKPLSDTLMEEDETVVLRLLSYKSGREILYAINKSDSAMVIISDNKVDDTLDIIPLVNPFSSVGDIKAQLSTVLRSSNTLLSYYLSLITSDIGTIISIKSSTPLKSSTDNKTFGRGIIYDALGNIVKNVDVQGVNKNSGIYGVYWDGTNIDKRIVGAGMYLLRLHLTTSSNIQYSPSVKIGITSK